MTAIVTERGAQEVQAEADARAGALWMSADEVERVLGWTLKPEGLCRGPMCVPLRGAAAMFLRGDGDAVRLDVAGLWKHLGKPVRCTDDASAWLLGESAGERTVALQSLEAPDFSLPDLEVRLHALSHYRGSKVLIASWASW